MQAGLPESVGNDVVDLCNVASLRHLRWTQRAFTDRERTDIGVDLWRESLAWGAKEAAYKAYRRIMPEARFIPREYEVVLDRRAVRHEGIEFVFKLSATKAEGECLAVVAATCQEVLMRTFHFVRRLREADANPSQAVRAEAALIIAERNLLPLCEVSFSTPDPWHAPVLYLRGEAAPSMVSFSHDGRFLAFSITEPRGQTGLLATLRVNEVRESLGSLLPGA